MSPVVPAPFLFRYSIPVRRIDTLPRTGTTLLDLPAECSLPDLGALAGHQKIADVRLAWNAKGLGVSVSLAAQPVWRVNSVVPEESDGLTVWIDTRNTQSIHRASRFCHQFCILPTGSGARGNEALLRQVPIPRAREEAPVADSRRSAVSLAADKTGCRLEAWLPGDMLTGFDPEANPRLGFYYRFRAAHLGEQFLTVGHEFPYGYDPSIWSTLELVG